MIVVAEGGAARLEEAENLKGFNLLARYSEGDLDSVGAALADAGRVGDGHAWIDEAWLRTAAGPRDAAWKSDFDKMVAFAKSKGWYDEPTRSIRAHIEWAE